MIVKLPSLDIKRLTFDFETRSSSNLKAEGAYKYSLDPTTRPTCLAFKPYGGKLYFLRFEAINKHWKDQSSELRNLWKSFIDDGFEFSAHNAFFETCIYKNILVRRYGWPDIPFDRFRCTAAKAAACALPRNLEGAGEAMALRVQKDRRGYVAMMATCKPTRAYSAWMKAGLELKAGKRISEKKKLLARSPAPPMFLEYEDAPHVWETLYTYCKIDVRAEELLDQSLPDLLPDEQEIWFLNQKLNWRGLRIDIPTVRKITEIMGAESKEKLSELDELTLGLVTKPGARKSILEFLALEGIELPDIRAKTVEDVLKADNLSGDMKKLLQLRQALSKTSTRKYQGFIDRSMPDDHRVRDILMFHGASTGRDTGTGVQPHNFPKGVIFVDKKQPYAAIENVIDLDREGLQLLYGESLALLFSSILRNMIIPSVGKQLVVADFSKIEVAVLWWLSENVPGLKILKAGLDPYKYQAAANLGMKYEDIADEGEDRQLGKAQILGCGFGMGAAKFQTTAWDFYRLKLTAEQSRSAVYGYRSTHPKVPEMWKNVERAAIKAVEDGVKVTINKCKFFYEYGFLWIELPSGRRLAYRDPKITWRETEFGSQKTLVFWAVNSKTKKWGLERTWGGTLTENIVQAVARDLMMPAMVRVEKKGYQALLMVHDEGICERENPDLEEFTKLLCKIPSWGKGLPLEAKGWVGLRYRK